MILTISGEINNDSLERLVKSYNDLKDKEILEIYLNSEGGDPDFGVAMLDIINENPDRIHLVGYGKLFSAGFDLFLRARCTKDLLRGTLGMAHITSVEMADLEINKQADTEQVKAYKGWMIKDKKEKLDIYERLGFSKKELASVKKGNDVYFHFERLLELLKIQQIEIGESNDYIS